MRNRLRIIAQKSSTQYRCNSSVIPPSLAKTNFDESVVWNLFQSFAVIPKGRLEPVLSPFEFNNLLNSIGLEFTSEKQIELFASIDRDGDSEITFSEFRTHYKDVLKQGELQFDQRAIFNLIDKRKQGFFCVEDLAGSLTTSGKITESEAENIVSTIDKNNDRCVSYEEFSEMIKLNPVFCWKLLSLFRVVFVVGGPASGKGTICEDLVRRAPMKLLHVSSGNLLRDEIETGSLLGQSIAATMRAGQLCDAGVVITLLKKILFRSPGRLVLIDGFPRSLKNAKDFVEQFGMGECCLHFDCPREVMISRIIERGKKSGRIDDNEETAHKRIATYESQSKEPLEYFRALRKPIIRLDTMQSVEQNVQKLLSLEIFSRNKE